MATLRNIFLTIVYYCSFTCERQLYTFLVPLHWTLSLIYTQTDVFDYTTEYSTQFSFVLLFFGKFPEISKPRGAMCTMPIL